MADTRSMNNEYDPNTDPYFEDDILDDGSEEYIYEDDGDYEDSYFDSPALDYVPDTFGDTNIVYP